MSVKPNNTIFSKKTIMIIPILLLCTFAFHYFFLTSNQIFSGTGDALRQFGFFTFLLQHAFKDGNLFWSFDYGLGGDLFGEFSYYYSTAPFFWITLLLPKLSIEQIFDVKLYMSILKSFLAMLFMYGSLRYHNKTVFSSFVAAIIYGGCITFMRHSLLWDFMADAIVFLPLVIWGLDKYIIEKKRELFLVAVTLMLASNFYFAFITSIFMFIYAFFQYFATQQNKTIVSFLTYYIRIGLLYGLSLGLAAVCFLPSVNAVFSADRLTKKFDIPLFFEDKFYKDLMETIFFVYDAENHQLALPALILFLIIFGMFIHDKLVKNKVLFTFFMFILFMLPYTYSVFNGFSAMQSRWLYLFVFVIAQTIAYILDWMLVHKKKHKVLYIISSLVATGLFIYTLYRKVNIDAKPLQKVDIMLIGTIVFSAITLCLWRYLSKPFIQFLVVLNIIISTISMNYIYAHSILSTAFGQRNVPTEKLHEPGYDNKEEIAAIRYIQEHDKDFYRILNPNSDHNTPMLQDYHGTSTYQSLINYYVHDFMKNKYNVFQGHDTPSMFYQADSRLLLENMLGVKYRVLSANTDPQNIPYGYKLLKQVGPYNIYKNDYALPLGYVYDFAISEEEFSKLNFAQRDQLLLHAVVVNNGKGFALTHFDKKDLKSKPVSIKMEKAKFENMEKEGNKLIVHGYGNMIVPIDSPNMPGDLLVELKLKNKGTFNAAVNGKVMGKGDDAGAYSYPLERFVYNLGNERPDNLTISIDIAGEYEVGDLQANIVNYESVQKETKKLTENRLENIYYKNNYLKGDINSNKDGLLHLSVPYSKGWTIKVDGKETEFTKANSAFIGVPITKGAHIIEMTYVTPYFKLGMIISIVSLIICVALLVFTNQKGRRKLPFKKHQGAPNKS
ncbi:YfhO family protein [Bacillus cereus]|uniref:YfhO family protein n=1 Tax=Bacillus cereus TaxID=1396 RepID=UPI000BFC3776|nr:YfhO family protein [Bacillus cereus]PGQ13263.1 multidrug transporter [Bacillus cereus]PGS43058.1 multidrug transporter [Bacillus cereus]PGV05999.1 multidrug transporter [Bacillus cereus]